MTLNILEIEKRLKAELPYLKEEVMAYFASSDFKPYKEIYDLTSTINPCLPLKEIDAMLSDTDRFHCVRELIGFRFKAKEGREETSQEEVFKMLGQRNLLVDQLLSKPIDSNLTQFDCFDSVLKAKAKARTYLITRGELFNAKAWRQYYIELYKLHYPKYTAHSNEGLFQFLKKFEDGYFGFELDFRSLQDQIKSGILTLPKKNDIIWVSKPFSNDKQVLGELDFVSNVAFPSAQDYFITNKIQRVNGKILIKSFVNQTPKGDKILLHGDEEYGQKIIRCAYISSQWNASFNNMYLDFLMRGIEQVTA